MFSNLNFDIRQLNTFVTISDMGSFSRASAKLFIAQPALSRQIRLLEEALGVSLFVRHGRGVMLTAAGELLYKRSRLLLQELDSIKTDVAAVAGEISGNITLGLIPSMVYSLSGVIVEKYRQQFPQVSLTVEQAMSGTLQELTEQNRVHLAIMYAPKQQRNLQLTTLPEESLYLVGPPHSPFANLAQMTLTQALTLPLVLPGTEHGLRITIEDAAAKIGKSVNIDTQVNALPLQIEMVRRGLAYTILPYLTVHDMVSRGELSASCLVEPNIPRKLVLAVPANRPSSVATQKLAELIRNEIADQVDNGMWGEPK